MKASWSKFWFIKHNYAKSLQSTGPLTSFVEGLCFDGGFDTSNCVYMCVVRKGILVQVNQEEKAVKIL